jgi:hypothetical protein
MNSTHQKVSSFGQTAAKKTDGYAKGPIPPSMIPTKVGVTNKQGYTGPNVARGKH